MKSRFNADERPDDKGDGRETEWHLFITYIDDLLADNDLFRTARPTLEGIRQTVETTGWVTREQRATVRHVVRHFMRLH